MQKNISSRDLFKNEVLDQNFDFRSPHTPLLWRTLELSDFFGIVTKITHRAVRYSKEKPLQPLYFQVKSSRNSFETHLACMVSFWDALRANFIHQNHTLSEDDQIWDTTGQDTFKDNLTHAGLTQSQQQTTQMKKLHNYFLFFLVDLVPRVRQESENHTKMTREHALHGIR